METKAIKVVKAVRTEHYVPRYTYRKLYNGSMKRERNYDDGAGNLIVYPSPVGETILENFTSGRWTRPTKELRLLLPKVLRMVGYDSLLALRLKWSQKAGCKCGCSPGFIIKDFTSGGYAKSIHFDYAAA